MREKFVFAFLAVGILGLVQTVHAGSFAIGIRDKAGNPINDATAPTLVVKDSAGNTIVPTNVIYGFGVLSFSIAPVSGGTNSATFTITRTNGASSTSKGFWAAKPLSAGAQTILIVVDN